MGGKLAAARSWLRTNLFDGAFNTTLTVVILFLAYKTLIPLFNWVFVESTWSGTPEVCRQNQGACWAFIREKADLILFGLYPKELQWRPLVVVVIFIGLLIVSTRRRFFHVRLLYAWGAFLAVAAILLKGGILGLTAVDWDQVGGLPLTLMLSLFGISFSYPLGIILALGRRSEMPFIRSLSVGYIELIRGVPLISLLFMSSVMFPLFLPEGMNIHKVARAQLAIIMFSAAYMAEVVRGGLQAIPKGQYEASASLGLSYPHMMRLVILPQALKLVVPPTISTAIGIFKDTSLVIIISLFDLLYTMKLSQKDVNWLGFDNEAYLFVALIYFGFCFFLSQFGKNLEKGK